MFAPFRQGEGPRDFDFTRFPFQPVDEIFPRAVVVAINAGVESQFPTRWDISDAESARIVKFDDRVAVTALRSLAVALRSLAVVGVAPGLIEFQLL